VGAGDFDLTIDRFGESPSWLVAVGTQVAEAHIEGLAALIQHHRISGFQSEVGTGVGRVDLVASAAVLW
jgi:hypothetical protein